MAARRGSPRDAPRRSARLRCAPCRAGLLPVRPRPRRSPTASCPICAALARRLARRPRAAGALPNVPTLILSGAQDLRTPTSSARARRRADPRRAAADGRPLHRPLGARQRLQRLRRRRPSAAFFAGAPVAAVRAVDATCSRRRPSRRASSPTCTRPPGCGGKPGRTLTAVLDAIVDLDRQVIAATLQADAGTAERVELRRPARRLRAADLTRRRRCTTSRSCTGVAAERDVPRARRRLQPATIRISRRRRRAGHGPAGGEQARHRHARRQALRRQPRRVSPRKLSRAGQRRRRGPSLLAGRSRWPSRSKLRDDRPPTVALQRRARLGCAEHGQRARRRDLALPAPARREPRRLAALGRAGARSARAAQDKPLLVSIGYSSCHWCHVMERESFEDPRDGGADERGVRVREGRPRGAPRRRRALHGGRAGHDRPRRLAAERVPHARAAAVLRRHLLPARAAPRDAGVDAGAAGDRRGLERARRGDPRRRRAAARAPVGRRAAASPPRSRSAPSALDAAVASAARVLRRAQTAASAARRSSRRPR